MLGYVGILTASDRDSSVGPVRVVAGVPLGRHVGYQFEFRNSGQIDRNGERFITGLEYLRAEPLLTVRLDDENNRPASFTSRPVQVGAYLALE